jgi:CheY-like chemotaxis protein
MKITYDLMGVTFLVLDREAAVRRKINTLLKEHGASQVYIEEDGTEGLKLLRNTDIDIVICGANMQPLGGRDFARIVRRDEGIKNREIPIILATKTVNKELVEDARDSGVNDIVAKPLKETLLIKKLLNSLSRHREFVDTRFYVGPDRRQSESTSYNGEDRRNHLSG